MANNKKLKKETQKKTSKKTNKKESIIELAKPKIALGSIVDIGSLSKDAGEAMPSAVRNSLLSTGMASLAIDVEKIRQFQWKWDLWLKPGSEVLDQHYTGRCWLFAVLNVLREDAIKKVDSTDFMFSANYLMFYEKLELANWFMNSIIATASKPVDDREVQFQLDIAGSDGGTFNEAIQLILKYGLCPYSAMPDTAATKDSGELVSFLNLMLRKDAISLRSFIKEHQQDSDGLNKLKNSMM